MELQGKEENTRNVRIDQRQQQSQIDNQEIVVN